MDFSLFAEYWKFYKCIWKEKHLMQKQNGLDYVMHYMGEKNLKDFSLYYIKLEE